MSEQMTSRDIEDVLVSIRRLVTEDLRPAPRDDAAEGGKLLLTPAHRVIPEPAGARPVMPAAPPAEPRVDLVLAALGRAVRDREPDWESETGDPSPLRLETPAVPAPRPATPHHGGRIRFAAAPAAVEPADEALSEAAALPDPDILTELDEVAEFHHQAPGWAQIEPAPAEPLSAPAPAVEAERPAATRDPAWSDAAEAAARAELEGMARPEPMQDRDYDDFADQAQGVPFDEATLRDIVRAVLREELAGPLGERITRNIRKLVHQEIARALAVRNLD